MKKYGMVLISFGLAVALMGCGGGNKEETTKAETIKETTAAETKAPETTAEQTEQETAEAAASGMANPWKYDVTPEDVKNLTGEEFIVPEGAEEVSYGIMESDKLSEMNFTLDGKKYCARMKPGTEFEDISGLFYDWNVENEEVSNTVETKSRQNINDHISNVLWFNGSMIYSLYTDDKEKDIDEVMKVAKPMFEKTESSMMAEIENLDENNTEDLENFFNNIDLEAYTKMIMEQAKEGEKKYPVTLEVKDSSEDVKELKGGLFITSDGVECRKLKLSCNESAPNFGVELYNNTGSDKTFDQTKFVIEKEKDVYINPFVFEQTREPETVGGDTKRLYMSYTVYDTKGVEAGDEVSVYYDGVFITKLTAEK